MIRSRVKDIMEHKSVTLRQARKLTGLSQETLVRARSAEIIRCRLETLTAIARALNVRVKDLFEEC